MVQQNSSGRNYQCLMKLFIMKITNDSPDPQICFNQSVNGTWKKEKSGLVGFKIVAATSYIQLPSGRLWMSSVPCLKSIGWKLAKLAHFEIFGWLAGWAGLRGWNSKPNCESKHNVMASHHAEFQLDSSKCSSYPNVKTYKTTTTTPIGPTPT